MNMSLSPSIAPGCCCLICLCRYSVHLKLLSQRWQLNGLSSECVDRCLFSLCLLGHSRWHTWQTCFFFLRTSRIDLLAAKSTTEPLPSFSLLLLVEVLPEELIPFDSPFSPDCTLTSDEELLERHPLLSVTAHCCWPTTLFSPWVNGPTELLHLGRHQGLDTKGHNIKRGNHFKRRWHCTIMHIAQYFCVT